jgi:hypothetical protein
MTVASFPLSPVEVDGFAGRSAALGELLRSGEMTRIVGDAGEQPPQLRGPVERER